MSILKKRIAIVLCAVMLAVAMFPMFLVNAASETREVVVSYGGKELAHRGTVTAEANGVITLDARSADDATFESVYYIWDGGSTVGTWRKVQSKYFSIAIPTEFKAGESHFLYTKVRYTDGTFCTSTDIKFIIEESESQVTMSVKLDGTTMNQGKEYEVNGGEKIVVTAESTQADIAFIGYYYDSEEITDVNGDTLTITVPTGTPGTKKTLYIEAVASNDDGTPNVITKTGWIEYYLVYPVEEEEDRVINVKYDGEILEEGSRTEANLSDPLTIVAAPEDMVEVIYFKWDNDSWQKATGVSTYSTRIPTDFEPGTTHKLYVKAEYEDGTESDQKVYIFEIPETAAEITVNVKINSKTAVAGRTYEVEGGEEVVVRATATGVGVDYIKYKFGSDDYEQEYDDSVSFDVPEKREGSTLKLYVEAVAKDGTTTGTKVYNLEFTGEESTGELDIEPWMEENDELDELAINLRNDSLEDEKANKNIYALDETITYYIDYKNGTGKDIDSEVSIELELPLDFEIVDDDNGEVDEDDRILRWIFAEGLQEDEAGTLVVKVKYTDFSKSKYDSERVYPSAAIYRGSKERDRSTVINFIIEEYDMEIDELHEPYMYGDANGDTFRPDDTITRAEGALVLARIYGLNYENTRITDVFSDLDETYPEAQRAIIAATKAGLIGGYTDGTYRPNNVMTKAEFMKILACMVEEDAEAEDIVGLEIKPIENNIKAYADSTRYYIVDGERVYTHWAIEEVTLLARLNMTPLSEDEEEIDLDEEITRAEVAQLVNFYLLRAPADVTSKTKSGFDDVSYRHDLFADIIEATREAHTFSMNEEDGTEVEE